MFINDLVFNWIFVFWFQQRLRENGEITQTNDVICNLKDFNEYRQQLHKTRLYYVLQELNRQVGTPKLYL